MIDKPKQCIESGCPLAITCRHCKKPLDTHIGEKCADGKEFQSLGQGFSLGTGDPRKAKYAFVLEAPGREEIGFKLSPVQGRAFFADEKTVASERNVRRRDYPSLADRYITVGAPVVGRSGAQLQYQAWPKAGIDRGEIFLDNVLRCLPPQSANGAAYPTGKTKQKAEAACRQYDRIQLFKPNTAVLSLHPAGLLREITPLPLQVKDMERIRDFTKQGRKVLGLLGGKASTVFLGYASNITRWRGHYTALSTSWYNDVRARLDALVRTKKAKKSKEEREDDFFPISAHIARKKALQEKISAQSISAGSSEDHPENEGVSREPSDNGRPKKTRKRAAKKISKEESITSSEKSVVSSEETSRSSGSVSTQGKVSGV